MPNCGEELAVEVGDVIKEMLYEMPDGLLRFQVFLSTDVAITADEVRPAVEAILFLTLLQMGHRGKF
jgi:hypothetical protein